jgi:transposase-like protein
MKTLGNVRDVFKSIKHSKPKHIYCPRCGSPNLQLSSSLDYFLTPQKYFCNKCSYMGTVFMELEKQTEEETKETEE